MNKIVRRDVIIVARLKTVRPLLGAEQLFHVFERTVLGLRIEEVDERNADKVDCHEYEVGSRADVLLTTGPGLSGDDGTDRASGSRNVESTSAVGCWENLKAECQY